jgi:hypothetical protein
LVAHVSGWEAPAVFYSMCSVSRHPHDNVGSVKTSPLAWDNACCCLCDRVSMTTYSLFFYSFLSFPFKIHIDHSKYHSCSLIYWYFNFGVYFFISNFCYLPFCQIPICFQFHHWIHNCDLLFFKSDPYYFVLRPSVNLISIFISPPQFKILGYTLFFFNFKFDLHSLHCYFCFVLDPFV